MNLNEHLVNKRLWITGASGGIGYAIAQAALSYGARVAVSGRRGDALETLRDTGGERLLTLPFDICDANAAHLAADTIRQTWHGADWIIANAGDCLYINPPQWNKESDDAIRRMIDINYYGVINTATAGLPLLANDTQGQNNRGLFATTISAAVYATLPRGCAYGAAKTAAAYFVQSLRGHYPHVDFSLIYPGFVKTPLTDKNDFDMPFLMSAEKAADIILRGLQKRRATIRFPRRLIALLQVLSFLPSPWQQKIYARMLTHA